MKTNHAINRLLLSLIALTAVCVVNAQLSIEECYRKAHANYPQIKQYELIKKTEDYSIANAAKGYLPQFSFSAKASYQSEVTKVPMPGIKGMDKDQYNTTLDMNQVIWDGGQIKSQKASAKSSAEVENKSTEVDLYSLNDRVNTLFFGALLANAQLDLNLTYQSTLQDNYDKVTACIEGGMANESDLDAVKIEQLKAKQSESALRASKNAYMEMLGIMIGEKLDTETLLQKPLVPEVGTEIERPELALFDAQQKNLDVRNREINASLMPKLSLFATGGYGRPGLDMLKTDFSLYALAGIRVAWNIGSFYTLSNRRKLVDSSKGRIAVNRETFLFNTNLDVSRKQNEIKTYREQMKYDDEIISLRASVSNASEVKMEDGTISGTDLMRDIKAEDASRQDKIVHEIQFLSSIYSLKHITNN